MRTLLLQHIEHQVLYVVIKVMYVCFLHLTVSSVWVNLTETSKPSSDKDAYLKVLTQNLANLQLQWCLHQCHQVAHPCVAADEALLTDNKLNVKGKEKPSVWLFRFMFPLIHHPSVTSIVK